MNQQAHKGGFFNLPSSETCRHSEHNFPAGLYIPEGKGYTHVCPACGKTSTATNPPRLSLKSEIFQ